MDWKELCAQHLTDVQHETGQNKKTSESFFWFIAISSSLFYVCLHTFFGCWIKINSQLSPVYGSMKQELTNRKAAPTLYRIRNPQKPRPRPVYRIRNPQKHRLPLGPQTYVTKARRATPSRITSCLEPNLLKTAEAHISVLTTDTQLAWGSQNQQPPALLKLQEPKFPEDHPYSETEIRLKIQAIFMASDGHHHVGSPRLDAKPMLLTQLEATSPVVTAWQCRWATCEPQVASPLFGDPA